MKRRQFVFTAATFALLSGCGVLPNLGKPRKPGVARVGILMGGSTSNDDEIAGLKQGLTELLGHVDGQTIAFEQRVSGGKVELETELANELVRLPVDVIVALESTEALAARQATTVIPIVFAVVTDPVGQGIVASLDHPGGNLTGVTNAPATVFGKQLELLVQCVPQLSRVVVAVNLSIAGNALQLQAVTTAATVMGVQLKTLDTGSPDELEPALTEALAWPAGAMMSLGSLGTSGLLPRLVDFQVQNRIPMAVGSKEFVQAGGLLTYAASYSGIGHTAASLVDKIIKGAKPADLPVEQPDTFDFAVNQTTAQALGLTIPPEIAQQVTQWVQ